MKKVPKIKIELDLGNNKKLEKKLTPKIVCALFDLQYLLTSENWADLKLNKMDKDLKKFFRTIEMMDNMMHLKNGGGKH